MANILRTSIACLALSAFALSASADQVGSVATITGESDAVIVLRGTETFTLAPGDVLFEGDRVITRGNGSTDVTAYGCSRSVASLQSITIAPDFCTQTIASVSADGIVLADAAIEGGTGGVGAALPVVGLLAAAGAAAGAAGGGGDSASSP